MLSRAYDPRQLRTEDKSGINFAMSMTEKQGGSDLRANTTTATPTGGDDREFVLTGHKWFCSAPMGDLFLLTAATAAGVSLFVAPRILPDGSRNGIHIERLKDKIGNRSNASSELALDDVIAYRIGEEGRGIRTFIANMTHYIRMDLAIASAAIMRQALTLAIHHTRNRHAFGNAIADLPQMRNSLADMAIESEAALLLGMRMARAVDDQTTSEHDRLLARIGIPVAKYWNAKRVNHLVVEALECHGGMGYVEEQSIARLYREAPLNGIWEGTSAMMGLDVIRALRKEPGARGALFTEIRAASGADVTFDRFVDRLEASIDAADDLEPHARRILSHIAMALQGSLLLRHSTSEVADAFVRSRLGGEYGGELGTLPATGAPLARIVERASVTR